MQVVQNLKQQRRQRYEVFGRLAQPYIECLLNPPTASVA